MTGVTPCYIVYRCQVHNHDIHRYNHKLLIDSWNFLQKNPTNNNNFYIGYMYSVCTGISSIVYNDNNYILHLSTLSLGIFGLWVAIKVMPCAIFIELY